jgi:hypothetical protein
MHHPHRSRVLAIFLLLLIPLLPSGLFARAAGPWSPVATPPTTGIIVGAALLPDGQVFVRSNLSAARYDPLTDHWAIIAKDLNPLGGQAMTTLPNGDVLLIGGMSCGHCSQNVERYDPHSGVLSSLASLPEDLVYLTATTLNDGRVLVTGGAGGYDAPWPSLAGPYAKTELYDPATNTWTAGPPMATGRARHTATLLKDGRVLVVGGATAPDGTSTASAEIYDPVANSWTTVASSSAPHAGHTATLLPSGQVLVIGGVSRIGAALVTAERYDPATNIWTTIAPLPDPRVEHTATLMPDGSLLIVGGKADIVSYPTSQSTYPLLATAIRYNPATDSWSAAGTMSTPRAGHTSLLLPDRRVIAVGGDDNSDSAEIYTDAGASMCFTQTNHCIQGRFLTYWQAHGGLAINGYPLSDEFQEKLEDGKPYTVQYFERVRMEYHPEAADPQYQVLLGQFGRRIHPADPPTSPAPGTRYFANTGHNLGGSFERYWEANGGLPQFGYPITDEFKEQLEDGKTYTVQYTERARFEYHPENAPPNDVLLGQFGRQILGNR